MFIGKQMTLPGGRSKKTRFVSKMDPDVYLISNTRVGKRTLIRHGMYMCPCFECSSRVKTRGRPKKLFKIHRYPSIESDESRFP
jgi:hypothetical protein